MVMIHDDVVMMLDVDGWWRRLDVLYEREKERKRRREEGDYIPHDRRARD